jgi:hypothetical protein
MVRTRSNNPDNPDNPVIRVIKVIKELREGKKMAGLPYIVTDSGRKVEMPFATKERPRCRQTILALCNRHQVTVTELWDLIQAGRIPAVSSLKKQCKRMVWEAHIDTAFKESNP